MSSFKTYNKIILGFIGPAILFMVAAALYTDPTTGELTRLGGYLEKDFGWNLEQQRFPTPLYAVAESLEEYDRHYDVIVYEDSFSRDLDRGWLNYLVAKTGWSVLTLVTERIAIDDIRNTEIYRNSPPKLFIYETVERYLIRRNQECLRQSSYRPQALVIEKLLMQPVDAHVEPDRRPRYGTLSQLLNPSPIVDYLQKAIRRSLLDSDTTEVARIQLATPGLFSHAENDFLLVTKQDFQLRDVTDDQI
jgi:hypothetical protein